MVFLFFSSIIFFLSYKELLFFLATFLFFFFFSIGPSFFSSFLFFDFFGWSFFSLSVFVFSLMVLGSYFFFENDWDGFFFYFIMTLLVFFLFFVFTVLGFFSFFFLFECSVIPIFLMILGWGFSFERLQAGMYMFLYTLTFSLPFLFFVFFYFDYHFVWNFLFGGLLYDLFVGCLVSFFLFFVFMVKLPCYFFHLWLPKAHVEAPMSGSMILAGILLKMGGYGLFRFSFFFFDFILLKSMFVSVGFFGALFSGFICFRQVDMKCMVAYMSVSHMGLLLSSFLTLKFYGFLGFFFMMLAHGLSSSGLFCVLGVIYERLSTRSVFLLKGSFIFFGMLSFFSFLLVMSNMSCPPTFNFFSELFISWGLFSFDFFSIFFFCALMMVGCFYSIHFFVLLFHGSFLGFFSVNLFCREYLLFFNHCFPLFFIFFIF